MLLYLCEKPSQAKDIARVLGAAQRRNGYCEGPNVIVTWCVGHLIEAAPPERYGEQYKRWTLDSLPILPTSWRVEIKAGTATQFRVIQRLLKDASEVIIATDADREGEMIARELLDECGYRGPVRRLWLSALNDASIRKALGSLRSGEETLPLYHAALARARADWLTGMNLSRLFTILGRQAGYDGVLSVGRVQTPTLQLVVSRDREIARFVSVPYWAIEVMLSAAGRRFKAHWLAPEGAADGDGHCLKEPVAHAAAYQIRAARVATVLSVQTEHVREPPPLPFDLGTLQTVCSRRFGLDVQETLNIAQSLYETHKATTYPRCDCRYLPESMLAEVPAVLDALSVADPTLQPLVGRLDRTRRSRAWDDRKITAHHGIIPTLEPPLLSALSPKERCVYELIRSHYLAQFAPHYEYERTLAQLRCGEQTLQARGQRVTAQGWRIAFSETALAEDEEETGQVLPMLEVDTPCEVAGIDLKALKTMPPKPYTQGELINAMKGIARLVIDPKLKQKLKETTGIGTEATRAAIIEGLLARGYLVKEGRRAIRATPAAFMLIDAVPAAIADPGTTGLWEQALDLIASRQLSLEAFVKRQAEWVAHIVEQYAHAQLLIELPKGPACPYCSGPTRRRKGKRGAFWSCSRYPDCRGTLSIESSGRSSRPANVRRHRTS